ncbi:MAG: FAD-dependent oxidoreductase [Luteolibacter sp.]|uniref:FAD-dependent oxidoreductase n=1 Tax=Luteolibacter sp. TaxID=1962973 RepID=UPI0032662A04
MKSARETFDVAVIGGGSAGLAAAVTAARQGARTLLIERHGYLGGMGTASLVHSFCGLYLLRDEPGAVLANPGFASEMAERMIAATGIGPVRMGRVDVLPQHPVEFVRIADELISAEPMIELRLHSEVTSISRESDWNIGISGRSGAQSLTARALVDASGDATAAAMLGLDSAMVDAPRLQRPAYVFGVHRPGGLLGDSERLETAGLITEGIREGCVPRDAMGLTFRSSGRDSEIFGTLDLSGGENYDPFDARCLTQLEILGRSIAAKTVAWLAGKSVIWNGSYVSQWPVRAGVRESRRWIGEYVLTGSDLLAGNRFEDEVALATWPMEFRETARGPKLRFPKENQPAGIPLRCLKPVGMDGLFVAGRCISADHEAQASIRVMGTCFATGEAAGRAAASFRHP